MFAAMPPGIALWDAVAPASIAAVSGGSDSVALTPSCCANWPGARRTGARGSCPSQSSRARRRRRGRRRGVLPRAGRSSRRARRDRRCATCPASAAEHGVSIEVAGRHARQRFFREALASVKADRVAVAHTRDDQAETVMSAAGARRGRERPGRDGAAARSPGSPAARHDAIGAAGLSSRA